MPGERRSMADALTPEKVAFLKAETPEEPESRETRVVSESPLRSGRGRVTVTVRLEPEVVAALSKASAERKVRELHPYTQQDIIGEALKQWLEKVGFWKS
jgi:hypothetical protein